MLKEIQIFLTTVHTFTFKSTWGVTRDPFDLFDISAEGRAERDMVENFGNASKLCEEVGHDFGHAMGARRVESSWALLGIQDIEALGVRDAVHCKSDEDFG